MKRVYKSLALFICFLMVASICFAKEYPVSKQTYNELSKVGVSIINEGLSNTQSILTGSVKLAPDQHSMFNRFDAIAMRLGMELIAIQKMLDMEFRHAEENQLSSKATGIISEYVDLAIKDANRIIEECNEDLNNVIDKWLKDKLEIGRGNSIEVVTHVQIMTLSPAGILF